MDATIHDIASFRQRLQGRAKLYAMIRTFFSDRGVLEVETPILSAAGNTDPNIESFHAPFYGHVDAGSRERWLRTSPEYPLKRLLADGVGDCYELGRVFRNGEAGERHNPEFTMLEWYRAGESYEMLMADCSALLALAAETVGAKKLTYRGAEIDPFLQPERISVAAAFERYAGIDLFASIGLDGSTDRERLASDMRQAGIRFADDDLWQDLFSRVLVEKIEPNLGFGRATILDEYPVSEAALARPSARDHRVAERFELYACGVELANAFGELTNAEEQRRRFEIEMAEKQRVYGETYPLDEDFLQALALMPDASGIALGFDRLVMLATGASRIEQVLWAPVAEYGA